MRAFLNWGAFLLLLSGLMLGAHWGLQFTAYPYFLSLTAGTAFVALLAMRLLAPEAPIDQPENDKKKDDQ